MQPTFKAIGISYRDSPLAIREMMAFGEERTKTFLKTLNSTLGLGEVMILSTCNRTEIYYSSERALRKEILTLLAIELSVEQEKFGKYFKELPEDLAIRQLYKVALGLDSKVLGDIQISNQVKKAYQWSADEGMAGPFLHRLLHSIFYTNKRVVQETSFRDGAASVAYATVELIKQFAPNFHQPKVLVLGLGEMGANIAENLQGLEGEIVLANRSIEKAESLGSHLGFEFLVFDEALVKADNFDVIVSTVASRVPVLHRKHFEGSSIKHKMFIDLSVPRSIDPTIADLHHTLLYNIDDIDQKTSAALLKRKKAVPQVEEILEESLQEFHNWAQEMEVSPTIQKLKNALEEIRKRELAKYVKKASDSELKLLDSATKGIIQKVIRLPVLQLKAACKRGDADNLVETLTDLFDLESEPTQDSQ